MVEVYTEIVRPYVCTDKDFIMEKERKIHISVKQGRKDAKFETQFLESKTNWIPKPKLWNVFSKIFFTPFKLEAFKIQLHGYPIAMTMGLRFRAASRRGGAPLGMPSMN